MSALRARRHVPLLASLVITGLVAASCSGSDDAAPTTTQGVVTIPETIPSGTPLVFGYLRPAAGLLSQLATAQEDALGLAVSDINDAGGVDGTPVKIVSADEPADGDVAGAIKDLVDQGASIVMGPVGSTSAQAALPALEAAGTVACSASATAPLLTTSDTKGVFYRTAMSDSFTVTHVADVLEKEAKEQGDGYKVAIVGRTDDYGIGFTAALTSVLLARGVQTDVVAYPPRRVVFTEEAAKVKALGANAVVLVSYGEAVRLVDDLIAGGVPSTTIIGLDGMMNPRLASQAFPNDPTRLDGVRVIGSSGNNAFLERLAAVAGTDPQFAFGAQMYDCAMIAALAATASGSVKPAGFTSQLIPVTVGGVACSTYADCVEKLGAGEDIDYQGASGGVHFDDNGDASEVRFSTNQFKGDVLTEIDSVDFNVDDIRQQEAIAGAIFVARLQQVLFALGYYTGPIDGIYSEEVVTAVKALQVDRVCR